MTINLHKIIASVQTLVCFKTGSYPAVKSRRTFLFSFVLASFADDQNKNVATASDNAPAQLQKTPIDSVDLKEHYSQDGYETLNVIRVDVKTFTQSGNCSRDDLNGCTLDDVNKDTNNKDNLTVDIPVGVKAIDFASDLESPNAIMRQRGKSVRRAPQKSYRIKIDSKKLLWRKERRLQLNKHPYDASRIRNKLAFDLMQSIPHLGSLRTQFVNLWIDDGAGPEDYGLFTHVEHVGKEYVRNRGINEKDNIYKAEYFQFSADLLKHLAVDSEGQPLNLNNFETRLEIKRGNNHKAVYSMVKAVSDYELSFEDVLARFFDVDNVLAWVTTNLLLLQKDAVRQNFYLHNPANTEKFYFLPWDYDRSFEPEFIPDNSFNTYHLIRRLSYGYARGAYSVFLDRFYRMEGIHEVIMGTADKLRAGSLSDANIDRLADSLTTLVAPFTEKMPDAPISEAQKLDSRVFSLLVGQAYQQLKWQFATPLPPTLQEPIVDTDNVILSWRAACDVTASGPLTYDLHISSRADFDASVPEYKLLDIDDLRPVNRSVISRSLLPPGKLYVRLVARSSMNPSRDWQIASNLLKDEGKNYVGLVVLFNSD